MATSEFDRPNVKFIKPRIVCAALSKNGRIITGPHHLDPIMRSQIDASEGAKWWNGCDLGFVDQYDQFYTRKEAFKIAKDNDQIIRDSGNSDSKDSLYSKMLY